MSSPPTSPEPPADLDAFREDTRRWLADACPQSMRGPVPPGEGLNWGGSDQADQSEDSRLWLTRMAEQGFTLPEWPVEYGGGGLNRAEAKILRQELKALRARPALTGVGQLLLGPVLLEVGSETQKLEHLPKIARGQVRWCQGYSEPGAGSDLASLQCRAEDQGHHYLVNGSKLWTSYADRADWIFCLVRTDPDAKKHDGIGFLLIDMKSPGISTSKIRLISGESPFCETFFENVTVPKAQMLGEPTGGWGIAKKLLQYERSAAASLGGSSAVGGGSMLELAKEVVGLQHGTLADPELRLRIAQLKMDQSAMALSARRVGEEKREGTVGGTGAILKYVGTELNKKRYEVLMSILGTQGLGWDGSEYKPRDLATTRAWLRSKANSIEGSTSEIQLNIIAKRVLGMPD